MLDGRAGLRDYVQFRRNKHKYMLRATVFVYVCGLHIIN